MENQNHFMSKLSLLIRQNKGKKEIEKYKQNLSAIFEINISELEFISLELTDTITNAFFNSYKNSTKSFFKKYVGMDEEILQKDLQEIKKNFRGEIGYLITKQSENCGLVKVPINIALDKYREIIELDGDSLCIFSLDGSTGVYIDYFEETNEGLSNFYYEVSIWKS